MSRVLLDTHLLEVARLEPIDGHRDPFDRLLVCQSRVEPLLLFTCDQALAAYGSCMRGLAEHSWGALARTAAAQVMAFAQTAITQ